MKKIRVLIFVDSFRIGGSERQAVELIKRLDRSCIELIVACFQKNGPLLEELPASLGEVQAFPLSGFVNSNALRQAWRFLALLKRSRVQIVQCFDFYSNMFAIPLARLAGVPIVLGSRRDKAVMRTKAQQVAERWCFPLASGVVANSEAVKDHLVRQDGMSSGRVWVIHNGLDVDHFDQLNDGPYTMKRDEKNGAVRIGVVANLRPEKGHLFFLDVAQLLLQSYPQVCFVIAGDGSMRGRIEAKIRVLELKDHVQLTGAVKNVPAFLKSGNVDILVNPSDSEGFPNAVMEAMAAALPVVATDVGGTSELVREGLTGYLVQPGDGAAMADRLTRLCKDPETRRKMGEAGRRRIAEQFTADQMARKFENLYQNLVRGS